MSLKVMFLPLNYGDVCQDGVYDAFIELGCKLKVFDYMNEYLRCKNPKTVKHLLLEEVNKFKPNLIHLQIQHSTIINAETIHQIKKMLPNVIITNWTGDVRNYIPITYKKIAEVSDYNFISSTGQLDFFKKEIGKDIKYWQIGYNPKLYYPNSEITNYKYDAVFIGNFTLKEKYPGTEERLEGCNLLKQSFGNKFAIFGHGWPKTIKTKSSWNQRDVSSIYHQSICSVSISHYNDLDHYFSDRLLMSMASGRPVISFRFPKWESYFTNMCDLIIVDSIQQIPDMVKMLKDNPKLANYIGESGALKVLAEHTYYSRIKELLNIIGLI